MIIFLSAFAWFLAHMAPSLTVGDAGELVAASSVLGVAHSPGYPLYLLLAHALQTLVPFGSIAYRCNLISALSMAAALSVLAGFWRQISALEGRRITPWLWAGLLVTVACNASVIEAAAQTEVFSLMILGALLCVYCFWTGRSLCGVFGFALFLGNHHVLLFIAPACALAAATAHPWAGLQKRRLAAIGAVLVVMIGIGLSVYAYLPVRAASGPVINWGNPDTAARFWRVFTRKDYGTFSLTTQGAESGRIKLFWLQNRRLLGSLLDKRVSRIMILLAVAGWVMALAFKRHRRLTAVSMLGFFFAGPFFLCLGNPPFDVQTQTALERFYLLPWCMAALAAPIPFLLVFSMQGRQFKVAIAGVLSMILLVAAVDVAGNNSGRTALRENLLAYDFGRNFLRSVPPSVWLFIHGGDDAMYALASLIFAEGMRPDLGSAAAPEQSKVRDRSALVFPSIYDFEFRETPKPVRERVILDKERALAGSGPVYYHTLDLGIVGEAELAPLGIVQARLDSKDIKTGSLWPFYNLRGLAGPPRAHYRERSLVPYYHYARAQRRLWERDPKGALLDFRMADKKGPDAAWLKPNLGWDLSMAGARLLYEDEPMEALAYLEAAAMLDPGEPVNAANICVALEKLGRHAQTESCYQAATKKFMEYGPLFQNQGAYLYKRGRRQQASDAFKRYYQLTHDPGALRWIR
ncbi:MAG: DUF2723 domain-containing protein [Elusimicrobiota bacterium]